MQRTYQLLDENRNLMCRLVVVKSAMGKQLEMVVVPNYTGYDFRSNIKHMSVGPKQSINAAINSLESYWFSKGEDYVWRDGWSIVDLRNKL